MRVGHIFHRYLDDRSQWAYHVLQGANACHHTIYAPLHRGNWPLDNSQIIKVPFPRLMETKGLLSRVEFRINEWQIAKKLSQYADTLDVFHSHFMFSAWTYRNIILSTELPWVISLYGFDYQALPHNEPIWKDRYQWLFEHATGFLVEGPHGAQQLRSLGCENSKIRIQHLGCPFPNKPNLDFNPSYTFTQISGFGEKKGIPILLEAFQLIAKKYKEITLRIIGSGNSMQENEVQNLLANHPYKNRIFRLKSVAPENLNDALSQTKFLVQASRMAKDGDHEGGSPYIIQQALALGIPVVSTIHADIPQWVKEGYNGWLSVENNAMELALAMERAMLKSEQELESMRLDFVQEMKRKDHVWAGQQLFENYTYFVQQ